VDILLLDREKRLRVDRDASGMTVKPEMARRLEGKTLIKRQIRKNKKFFQGPKCTQFNLSQLVTLNPLTEYTLGRGLVYKIRFLK